MLALEDSTVFVHHCPWTWDLQVWRHLCARALEKASGNRFRDVESALIVPLCLRFGCRDHRVTLSKDLVF